MPDMIAARQELDLRPQLERLDRLMLRSEGLDPGALSFAFRPLWQLDAASAAAIALQKAQATQIYAGLKLWPAEITARLVEAQLVQDGTYPSAAAVFAQDPGPPGGPIFDYDPNQRRGPDGKWIEAGAAGAPASGRGATGQGHPEGLAWLLNLLNPVGTAQAQTIPPDEPTRRLTESTEPAEPQPGEVVRIQRFVQARQALKEIDPTNRELQILEPPRYVPSEGDIARMESAAREAAIQRVCDFLRPNGKPIGEPGTSTRIREMPGGLQAAQRDFDCPSKCSDVVEFRKVGWRGCLSAGARSHFDLSPHPQDRLWSISDTQGIDRMKLYY